MEDFLLEIVSEMLLEVESKIDLSKKSIFELSIKQITTVIAALHNSLDIFKGIDQSTLAPLTLKMVQVEIDRLEQLIELFTEGYKQDVKI